MNSKKNYAKNILNFFSKMNNSLVIFKLSIICLIIVSLFMMRIFNSYGKGSFGISENEMMNVKSNNDITNAKNMNDLSLICNKDCAKDCVADNQNNKINIIKCLDSCACNSDTNTITNDNNLSTTPEIETTTQKYSPVLTRFNVLLIIILFAVFNLYIILTIVKMYNIDLMKITRTVLDEVKRYVSRRKNDYYMIDSNDEDRDDNCDYEYKKITDI
jgi:hypothetical protein